jgi:hypothetical protein
VAKSLVAQAADIMPQVKENMQDKYSTFFDISWLSPEFLAFPNIAHNLTDSALSPPDELSLRCPNGLVVWAACPPLRI